METAVHNETRETLRQQGFIVLRSAIDPSLLEKATEKAWGTIEYYKKELKDLADKGDLPYCLPMPVKDHVALLDHAENLLKSFGADPYWLQNLMLIMKRPREGRRFWHTDSPSIYAPSDKDAPELFVLYFLQKTTVALGNGCLLVVPGYAEGPQHSERVTTPFANEHPIEVEVGDVIVFDPRLLHGSLENTTDAYRFNVRLWIQTRWKEK